MDKASDRVACLQLESRPMAGFKTALVVCEWLGTEENSKNFVTNGLMDQPTDRAMDPLTNKWASDLRSARLEKLLDLSNHQKKSAMNVTMKMKQTKTKHLC